MKRASIAETTLNKEIKILDTRLDMLQHRKAMLQTEIETVEAIKFNLCQEVNRLQSIRMKASKEKSNV